MKNITLSIVIPCYNEVGNIESLLEKYNKEINREDVEIILVNDGSKDGTRELLDTISNKFSFLKVVHVYPNGGYGNAVFTGLSQAQGKYIGWTHGDLQTPPQDVFKALSIIENNADKSNVYVKGRRLKRPLSDSFFTFGMSVFETLLFGHILYDINAQPNIFPREFLTKWENPPKDFSLDLYVFLLAKRNKMKVIRFPVLFEKRTYGISSWNVDWRSKIKFIKRTVSFSLKLRFT